jgi:hypothetical protein
MTPRVAVNYPPPTAAMARSHFVARWVLMTMPG